MHRHTHSHTIGQIKRVFGWWREREFNEWFCAHNSFGVKLNEDGSGVDVINLYCQTEFSVFMSDSLYNGK